MPQRANSAPPVSKEQRRTDRLRERASLARPRLEARAEHTIKTLMARKAQEGQEASVSSSSGCQRLLVHSLSENNNAQRTPTTRVRVRDLAGTNLCLASELDADPPGSVPACYTVHRARHSLWGYLHNGKPGDHNGKFTCEGNFSLSEYDFTYQVPGQTHVLGKSDILGTLPHGAVVTIEKPNGRPPLGESPVMCTATPDHSQETPPSTPPTPPSLPPLH